MELYTSILVTLTFIAMLATLYLQFVPWKADVRRRVTLVLVAQPLKDAWQKTHGIASALYINVTTSIRTPAGTFSVEMKNPVAESRTVPIWVKGSPALVPASTGDTFTISFRIDRIRFRETLVAM
ncbi:hypothetical protein GX586_12615 [bacterium]|nr:hypothetical protein [bacterium]